jgi:protein-tyrosine-phosphatase
VDARCCPSTAVAAAASLGIDLSGHRSKTWDSGILSWADVILIFDRKQTARLAAVYPEALPKSHYLGALDSAGPLETADPYGLDAAHFGNTYRTILGLLQTPGFRAD